MKPLSIRWSGCSAGCGLHQIGTIGLQACRSRQADGQIVDAAHVYSGGSPGPSARPAQELLNDVPCEELSKTLLPMVKFLPRNGLIATMSSHGSSCDHGRGHLPVLRRRLPALDGSGLRPGDPREGLRRRAGQSRRSICAKGATLPQVLHTPDRLTQPQVRDQAATLRPHELGQGRWILRRGD